ncbi:MAG: DUF4402 domain-containing protein [Bacteroidales bacterium]|nr:DUF4402 domain-containing protein [Bacteroidales bacterium]
MSRYLILPLLIISISSRIYSQVSVTAQAFAEVISALTATETSQLNFGKFSPEVQGGQVIVAPDGIRSTSGSVVLSGGISKSGIFYITGAPDAAFSIQLPSGSAVLVHQNSSKTMIVSNWVSYPQAGNGTGILANGQQFVYLGATLNVGSTLDNPVGLYSGAFNLTFAYN